MKEKGVNYSTGLHLLRSHQKIDLKLTSSLFGKITCMYVVLNYHTDKIMVLLVGKSIRTAQPFVKATAIVWDDSLW